MAYRVDTNVLGRLVNRTDAQHGVALRATIDLHRRGEWQAPDASGPEAENPGNSSRPDCQRPAAGKVRTGPLEEISSDSWSEKRTSRTARADRESTSSLRMKNQ